jgi:cyclin-dependent kinase 2
MKSISKTILNKYQNIEKIGEGAYGVVYRAIEKNTDAIVALKKIQFEYKENGILSTTIREISLLKELNHQNIVKLYNVFHYQKQLYLVFEYCEIDLKRLMEIHPYFGNNIELIKFYLFQIMAGISYCHQRRVLHRDLKPQNLLIDPLSNNVKIADFGLARSFEMSVKIFTHEVVTLWYRAPEILLGSCNYGTSIDIWSIGCIFAEMIIGKPLFPGDSEIDQLYKIFCLLGTPNENIWPGVSKLPDYSHCFPKWSQDRSRNLTSCLGKTEYNLLYRMLIFIPEERITARDAMQHYFFVQRI